MDVPSASESEVSAISFRRGTPYPGSHPQTVRHGVHVALKLVGSACMIRRRLAHLWLQQYKLPKRELAKAIAGSLHCWSPRKESLIAGQVFERFGAPDEDIRSLRF